jgi:uncharacterized protein (TIGR02147 family)
MANGETNYRDLLKQELSLRCAANPHYSLRAYARDLGASASLVSQVLQGKRGLSLKSANTFADQIGWSKAEKELFCLMVEAEHARNAKARKTARDQLRSLVESRPPKTLALDAFQLIADPVHFATLESLRISALRGNPARLAQHLGITEVKLRESLERMERLELVTRKLIGAKERWIVEDETLFTADGVPSEALKRYHAQTLRRAGEALYAQSIDERHFISTYFALDPDYLSDIKRELGEFNRRLMDRYGGVKTARETYAFGMQLFRVGRPANSKGEKI